MMLGTSPHLFSSGDRIPPALFDDYVRYKKDTRAIVAWLMSHGTSKLTNIHRMSIRDLLGLAEVVQKKAVVMPDTIDFQFREAIAARTQLSNFFKTKSGPDVAAEDTINHEFFTERRANYSLTKIYTSLCECCAKPAEDCKPASEQRSRDPSKNSYDLLTLGMKDTSRGCAMTSDTEGAKEGLATVQRVEDTPQLIDDRLGDAFGVRKALQETDDLLLATKKVWMQAGRGDTPLVVAALITNVAFARFEMVEQQLKLLCGSADPAVLRTKVPQAQRSPTESEAEDDVSDSPATQTIESLQQSWDLLLHLKNSVRPTTLPCACTQKLSTITLRTESDSADADGKCLNILLLNITQHVQAKTIPTDIVRAGSPMYAEIGFFLTHTENDLNGLRCTFGLRMLLHAYKSFVLGCQETCVPRNCRLHALKLAQEALPSIGAVLGDSSMPCRCYQTLAFHLADLELDLKAFLQEKCFDMYFLSPWVSSSHLLEMHETLFYYGLRLFSYRHYVGSVVHVYHVLREYCGFEPVPLLEQLRDTFNDVLFPGGRPTQNFKACCLRYMGGRLKFKSDTSDHRSGSHHMVIPAYTVKTTAGFGLRKEANDPRFAYYKISLFYHIKEKGYHLNESLPSRANDLADPSASAKTHESDTCAHDHPNEDFMSSPYLHQLSQLEKAVLNDFADPFPIARVNFFNIYMSCVRIISIVSAKTHNCEDYCLCFLDAMLRAADRYKANEHKLQPFGSKDLVNACKEAMSLVLGNESVDDFLWKTF